MTRRSGHQSAGSALDPERKRLAQADAGVGAWRRWGPYMAERQWGTVREDYSADGKVWRGFTHEQSRSRAYRWGEDGIAGFCDDEQRLCFAVALWNGRDPILKERLFGLDGDQGNHGEDVKELYYHVDATPTHSYMRYLYKYPQAEFPYARLIQENARRSRQDPEFELVDTGIFDDGRYFDVQIEYVKQGPEDILVRIEATNRGPEAANLWLLPQLWFRNTWSWSGGHRPTLKRNGLTLRADWDRGSMTLAYPEGAELMMTENETDPATFGAEPGAGAGPYKNAFHARIVNGLDVGGNTAEKGTKAGILWRQHLAPGEAVRMDLRLSSEPVAKPFEGAEALLELRRKEADLFYAPLQDQVRSAEERLVQRRAWAGLLWSKQFYYYDVPQWLDGDPLQPPPPQGRVFGRNRDWRHLNNADVIAMPDKWEFPWYATWDLAFHCVALADLDPQFSKQQLILLTREWYMHPNGQLPAYEWALDDVNPPVHAWAAWKVYLKDKAATGTGDRVFLARVFHKLLLNFNWWVNRKDSEGRNVFHGGFLGLDNVGAFNRSGPLPGNGRLEQADGTSWMALYCLDMLRIALELSLTEPHYQDLATKFFEHFLSIAKAMSSQNESHLSLWDQEDGFYYDLLHPEQGPPQWVRLQSIVGLLPLLSVETLEPELLEALPDFKRHLEWFLDYRPDLAALVSRWAEPGQGQRRLLSLLRGHRMKRLLRRMLNEAEFLSAYGVRSLSRIHLDSPYRFESHGQSFDAAYEPGESQSGLFGGNSNWRGPIWMPLNYMLVDALLNFHRYYGDDFRVEHPVGSGEMRSLRDIALDLAGRLGRLFLAGEGGRRPGMRPGPHGAEQLQFYEHFHGENGAGLGASHQTGWTALVADLIGLAAKERASEKGVTDGTEN